MRNAAAAAALVSLLLWPPLAPGAIDPAINARIDAITSVPIDSGRAVGIVVGVIAGGDQRIYAHGQTARGSGITPGGATIFEIGSITKTFTAMLLALDVQRGRVRLDDPLQNYVPRWVTVPSYNGRQITLLDLATHTSGLPDDPPLRGIAHLPDRQMYQFLNNYRLTRPPGAQYQYSNLGFGLLAHALMRAARSSLYQPLVEREICRKLGMIDTRVELTPDQSARQAQGYNQTGFPAPFGMRSWPALNGAGALRSTTNDMLKYLAFNMGLTQTGLDSLLPMLQHHWRQDGRPDTYVGLAWQTMPLAGTGLTLIWKNGGTRGFSSFIGFVRETGTGVIVLVNHDGGLRPGRIALRILRLLNRQPEQGPPDEGAFEEGVR